MHGPYPLNLDDAWKQLGIAQHDAWDTELKAAIDGTLALLKKLQNVRAFRSNCENVVLCAAQLTASLADVALARGVRRFFGEPPLFQKYQEILKSMLAFLEEQVPVHPLAAKWVATLTPLDRQMEARVNTMKTELQSAHQVLLVSLNRHLAPGEIPFDLSEDRIKFQGGFADVHIGWWRPIGLAGARFSNGPMRVAIKHIRPREIDLDKTTEVAVQERLQKRINREMDSWRIAMEHRHVLPFIAFSYAPHAILIAPWCENGHMKWHLARNPSADRMALLIQVADALNFLHTRQTPIIHGDIKPDNILIGDQFEALIGDFGMSKVKREIPSGWTTEARVGGTPLYMAPELHAEEDATPASDVYAFTFLLLEILSGKQPFAGMRILVPLAVSRGLRPKLEDHPAQLCYALWGLFERGWDGDPLKRPTMASMWRELQATARSSIRMPMPMPMAFPTITELDELASPMTAESNRHPGGTASAPPLSSVHHYMRPKNISTGGGIMIPHNHPLEGHVDTVVASSMPTTRGATPTSYSQTYHPDRTLSEGPTRWYGGDAWSSVYRRFTGPDPYMRTRGVNQHADTLPPPVIGSIPHNENSPSIKKIKTIHHGEMSDIWLADYQVGTRGPTMRVAIKYFRRLQGDAQSEFAFESLIVKWRGWHHPSILPLWHAETSPSPMMVTPWNRNGAITEYLRSVNVGSLVRYRLLAQIADGLAYLHSDKTGHTVHGHLQPGCIYVDDDGNARIGGFGLSLAMLEGHQHMVRSAWRGIRYKAPEILETATQTHASDVYALSMMGVEILSGHRPFNSLDGLKLAVAVTSGERPRMENHLEPSGRCQALWSGFEEMWDQDPEERPSAEEVHRVLRLPG
ncbi:hypothetical protein FRB94_009694 [Tulasnella sp. JGI-2019a]|nr:hypothetical protein FRB94_009694 [Tulasnella sp. JGI-2019a]KAG9032403.1 hypothetical protein FRB95_001524 [Tulasnella sp. JGI-2019a]